MVDELVNLDGGWEVIGPRPTGRLDQRDRQAGQDQHRPQHLPHPDQEPSNIPGDHSRGGPHEPPILLGVHDIEPRFWWCREPGRFRGYACRCPARVVAPSQAGRIGHRDAIGTRGSGGYDKARQAANSD
ncbi:hypothetical protein [Virgisporangium aurantiacum]|uniref:hypothetical protein n=1 Tax=Virgisporangium aurantiacum TaxID=175570 RepID=UPI00194E5053|nr:hypothetical protein [Virgisporangium aurantiacum]